MDFQWNEILKNTDYKNCVQPVKDETGKIIDQVSTLSCIPAIFSNVISGLLMLVGTASLVTIILAGFKYMNSTGDPKKLEGARETLIYGIIGLLLVLFSFFIINILSTVTGVECIKTFGFGCK